MFTVLTKAKTLSFLFREVAANVDCRVIISALKDKLVSFLE